MADPLRTATVGVSTRQFCGVRDHATLLAAQLEREGIAGTQHWLASTGTLSARRAELARWARALPGELRGERLDAVLWHYSVFSYSFRGVPLFVHPTLAALRRSGVPIIAIMHEIAFPWGKDGLRGGVWAVSQRAVLLEAIRACSAVVVTADFRAEWLRTRRWLPRRPIAVAPVFSNLPAPPAGPAPANAVPAVGLFGYALEAPTVALVLDALRALRDRGVAVELRLLGSPGRESAAGELWQAGAARRGLTQALRFSGTLPAQALSDALAACEVLLFADATGPASRKGTLAGSLASGRPVVALEGRRHWPALVDAGAAVVVPRSAEALGDAFGALLADEPEREAQGRRGRAFAEGPMGVAHTAALVRGLLADLAVPRPS